MSLHRRKHAPTRERVAHKHYRCPPFMSKRTFPLHSDMVAGVFSDLKKTVIMISVLAAEFSKCLFVVLWAARAKCHLAGIVHIPATHTKNILDALMALWAWENKYVAHLCWWLLPTYKACPCTALCWSDCTGGLWRWAAHGDMLQCNRSCTSVALPDNTSLCVSDCRTVKHIWLFQHQYFWYLEQLPE